MILEKYNSIMAREEGYRNRWALGLTMALTAAVFVSFAFYKGFINFGGGAVAEKNSQNQMANVISAESAPSPLQNSKKTFRDAFSQLNKQYQEFKDSLSSVLVPFVTSIEVYDREKE